MKKCSNCKVEKEFAEFSKRNSARDGFQSQCKDCVKKYDKEFREKNKEKIKEYEKLRYKENKEKINGRCKEYRENNREKILEKKKQYYLENKDEIKQHSKQYRENNKEIINERKKEYIKERRQADKNFAITDRLRHRIYLALKSNSKSKRTLELLGCSIEELKLHLEKGFYNNKTTGEPMTWESYGRFHIDHVLPCASFDLTDPEQQKICFHYTNLQVLWSLDNLKKSNKLDWSI